MMTCQIMEDMEESSLKACKENALDYKQRPEGKNWAVQIETSLANPRIVASNGGIVRKSLNLLVLNDIIVQISVVELL